MGLETLVLLAATIALPLLLFAIRGLFAWRYRRALERSMGIDAGVHEPAMATPPVAHALQPLQILRVRDATPDVLSEEARTLAATARAATTRVRIAFTVAALIFAVFVGLAMALATNVPADARVATVYLVVAPVLLILLSVLSLSRYHVAIAGAAYLLLGIVLLLAIATPARARVLITAQAELFLLLPAAGLVLLLSRRLRPMLIALVAIALYAGVSLIVGFALAAAGVDPSGVRWWLWPFAIAFQLLGIAIVAWLLGRRESARIPVAVLAAAAIAGLTIEAIWRPDFPIGPLLAGLPAQVLQVFAVWLVFRLVVTLQERRLLAPQVLHAHIAFAFFATYFVLLLVLARGSSLFAPIAWPVTLIAVGFVAYMVALHVLLRPAWNDREQVPGKRLLFLRTFGSTRGPERLLDALEDTWQRIGRIDLIAATDLAVRALGSRMIEAFIVRRVDAQFLRTPDDVTRRLGTLRSAVQGDARYPINDVYCHDDTWQLAIRRLAPESDAVLMDLRGFTRRNRGCVFELTELVRTVPLDRVVLLADRTSDLTAAEEIAATAWTQRTTVGDEDAQTTLTVLRFTGSRARDQEALFGLLLEAAVPGPSGAT